MTKPCCIYKLHHDTWKLDFLLTVPRRNFFCGSFMLHVFMSCVFQAFASVHCSLVVTWRERADLLALVCDVYCDFVTFPFGILGQVWYFIVSIPGPCCLSYFVACEQQRCRPACASAQSDQRLCYSLPGKTSCLYCYMQNKISIFIWATMKTRAS